MDIKTTTPEQYAEWLKSHGVPEEEIPARMMHDAMRALSGQFTQEGVPEGFEGLAKDLNETLARDALERALR